MLPCAALSRGSPGGLPLSRRLLAVSLGNLGKYADAEPLCRRALIIRESALGSEHPETANSLYNLAGILNHQRKHAEAEPLYRRARAVYEKALGPDHPNTVRVRNNVIQFYRKQGRNAEADALEKSTKGKAE